MEAHVDLARAKCSSRTAEVALRICSEILSSLDTRRPGFGHDVYHPGMFDYPDAYGFLLHAAARTGHEEIAAICGDWLVTHAHLARSGRTGWGLPFAYRTFGDAPNPPHTVYGITTAAVVLGLITWHQFGGRKDALQCAIHALDEYSEFFTGEHFQYSEFPADRLAVPNVDSMLAGQYARLAVVLNGRGQVRDAVRFEEIAISSARYILSGMQSGGAIKYAQGSKKKNDVVHYAYIYSGVRAVCELTKFSDRRALVIRDCAAKFYDCGRLREYPRPEFRRRHLEYFGLRPFHEARLWGLGSWLAATRGEGLSAEALSRLLNRYRLGNTFAVSPGDSRVSVRHLAHLAWGLSEMVV